MRGKIETTEARAKSVRPFVERCVEFGKKHTVASLRILMSRIPTRAAHKMYHEIAPRYKDRKGGYLRIRKTAKSRKRDGAMVVTIEFV
jgi:large subunit ribosomal protein L17